MRGRPGILTTEFWLSLVVTVMGAMAYVYADSQVMQVAGLTAATLTAAGYGFSRSQVKAP